MALPQVHTPAGSESRNSTENLWSASEVSSDTGGKPALNQALRARSPVDSATKQVTSGQRTTPSPQPNAIFVDSEKLSACSPSCASANPNLQAPHGLVGNGHSIPPGDLLETFQGRVHRGGQDFPPFSMGNSSSPMTIDSSADSNLDDMYTERRAARLPPIGRPETLGLDTMPGPSGNNTKFLLGNGRHEQDNKLHSDASGSRPQALTRNSAGVPYHVWRDARGIEYTLSGALLPGNYDANGSEDRPWPCPMRTCKLSFKSRYLLGSHFKRRHGGLQLRDNQDGTFSKLGTFSSSWAPSIVVSRGRSDANQAPPIPAPVVFESSGNKIEQLRQHTSPSRSIPNPTSALIDERQVLPMHGKFEMEEWEVAPGQIKTTNAPGESLAWSNVFLESNAQGIQVGPEVFTRIAVVKCGVPMRLEMDSERFHLVIVAGEYKVHAQVDDEPEFAIGKHGMFRVPPGRACTVRNIFYGDAVLHIVALPDF